ncbi:hypothetical protein [Bacillus phage SPbetaL6]|uniref:hypothetical protein n=1 Tax=Bacillus inaquosorum TaxID=483913 RepID=UPI00227E4B36|nr:hypothetical protein [Bacillus inaquosorum]MCY8706843.1 hypothetical protein [Bacillus inaquosorum]MCY9057993.1 hypothetical protein [Bacillus inaquosorum]WIT27812.1 hypothetical protein [Bacillus phage SPbetaL6]WIT27998.1 hypothetical protein [Bacillus phage SPbetaL7]
MHSIGIRVSTKRKEPKGKIFFAISKRENLKFNLIRTGDIIIPNSLEVPEQLAFIRTNLLAVFNEYNVKRAGLRVVEGSANTQISYRKNIEGVIQEVFANSEIEAYDSLLITKFARIFEVNASDIKKYINGETVFPGVKGEEWKSYPKEIRECIISSISMLISLEEIS